MTTSSLPRPRRAPSAAAGAAGAPLPSDELARLHAVHSLGLVDTPPEDEYDDLAALAAQICGTPMAAVSVLEIGRQWFKAAVGLPVRETRRDVSFCAWAVLEPTRTLVVPDALDDERFRRNSLVTGGPRLRSYAGVPLVTGDDQPVGALCVLDTRPRTLAPEQLGALRVLANQVVAQFELRRSLVQTQELQRRLDAWEGRRGVRLDQDPYPGDGSPRHSERRT